MKKVLALILAAVMLCALSSAALAHEVVDLRFTYDGANIEMIFQGKVLDVSKPVSLTGVETVYVVNNSSSQIKINFPTGDILLPANGELETPYIVPDGTYLLTVEEGSCKTYFDFTNFGVTTSVESFTQGECPSDFVFTVKRFDGKGTWTADMITGGFYTLDGNDVEFAVESGTSLPVLGTVEVLSGGNGVKIVPNAAAMQVLNSLPAGDYTFCFYHDGSKQVNGEDLFGSGTVSFTVNAAATQGGDDPIADIDPGTGDDPIADIDPGTDDDPVVVPQTGDNTPIALYAVMAVLFLGAALLIRRRGVKA